MIIEVTDNVMHFYQIEFDKNKILELREEIINKTSIIRHKKVYTCSPMLIDNERMKNYKYQKAFTTKKDGKSFHEIIFYIEEYDEYEFPNLVNYIDLLLKGNYEESLNHIFNMNEVLNNSLEEEKENLSNNIKKVFSKGLMDDSDRLTYYYEKYKEILNDLERNKNQESVLPYYFKLQKLINFKLLYVINKEDFNEYEYNNILKLKK